MDFSRPFSELNERLNPRYTTSEQLYSSLNRLDGRQPGSQRSRSSHRPTVLPAEPRVSVTVTEPQEPEADAAREDLVSDGPDEGDCDDLQQLVNNTCVFAELNLKEVDGDSSSTQSEEKDSPCELPADGTRDSPGSAALAGEGGSSSQVTSYVDGTLPDLINSGRPLSRRRTLGHVSATLNEVRREVELSRKRSIRLKAQVDKLQDDRAGKGWSQHRETVTDEVLSVLRLLHPLTAPESGLPEPSRGENRLDAALAQLQSVARKLAIGHTKQESKSGKGEEDSAILQQALRDRDEAIERKKGMEAELLRSKTEMMLLNNQLLEAVQKRLELSLELEAWKEDVQVILQQHLQSQQQAEQAQKKPSRLGILRRTTRQPIQRPATFPVSTPTPPKTNSKQIFLTTAKVSSSSSSPTASISSTPSPTGTRRNWMDKLRRVKNTQEGEDAAGQNSERGVMDGFQVVSLD
ncbi:putative bicaudal D-related protein -like [Scophthalmus maximus]|uniref:Putative bicaudal D-related protein-like n=2 Tax=Scophthalmus maximus TaxID=52904 RepID=A0A2U9B7Q5_SCOMX|nr:putative bicaudal D-related protein -like [Scophthalmus maximus]